MLGNRIRARRDELGLTRVELARRCLVADSLIGMIEIGERTANHYLLKRLAFALQCTTDELLVDEPCGDDDLPASAAQ